MKRLFESGWPAGWIPSANDKGDPTGQSQLGLLRMDNLTQDDAGILRIVKGPKLEATTQFPNNDIYAIFSCILAGLKFRFVYINSGANKAILCTDATGIARAFTTTLISQVETSKRCDFLNALGQVFMVAGGIQRKFDGAHNYPLGIAAPSPPVIVSNATNTVSLANLDGGGNYTNWASVNSTAYNNAGTNVHGTSAASPSQIASTLVFQTTYAAAVDTTNLGGTGNDTTDDIFQFNFECDDLTQLTWLQITLYCAVTPAPQNYFWKFWDFTVDDPNNPYFPFALGGDGVTTVVQIKRSDFFRVGDDTTKGWNTIKSFRVEVGILNNGIGNTNVTWDSPLFKGGALSILTGTFNYVAVSVRDTGGFLEFSPASTPVKVSASVGNFTITAGVGFDIQQTQYWLFRQDVTGGNYYRVFSANSLPLGGYIDFRPLADLITDANINSQYTLEYFRQPLPTNIISLIWFRDRIIYLTTVGFIPSFKLDPGSYDSRFVYEIVGSNSEQCLFIAKLDVGTFVIGTTKDFYSVTGTFSIIFDPNDPTGQVQLQDVNITPLGVSDPPISQAFVEYQGTIVYMSATGFRIFNNGNSMLINDNLDLLFRGENRFDLPAVQLLPQGQSIISAASQGSRIYWIIPHKDGVNRVYVLNIANQNIAYQLNTRSWRLITFGENTFIPSALCKEEDGNILMGNFALSLNYIRSLESDQLYSTILPVKFRTQFNYGGSPTIRKDALGLKLKVDTGNTIASLVIRGLQYDGTIKNTTVQFSTQGDAILSLDIKEQQLNINGVVTPNITVGLPPSIAYAVEISCLTAYFKLYWMELLYEERPAGVRRVIQYADNFNKGGRKRIGTWPFMADPMGLLSNNPTNISTYVTADGVVQPVQVFTGIPGPQSFFWDCDPTRDLLAYDWQIELVGDDEFEFYKFLPPDITEETPAMSNQVIQPATNFGDPSRKMISNLPFRLNPRTHDFALTVKVDGVTLPVVNFTGNPDRILTVLYEPTNPLIGTDWERRVTAPLGVEFYEWIDPILAEKFPLIAHYIIQPASNYDDPGRKIMGNLPFTLNSRGHDFTLNIKVDGIAQTPVNFTNQTDGIKTYLYEPTNGLSGVDWERVVSSTSGVEFYKWEQPIIAQKFPVKVKYAIQPFTNFGKANPKKISCWPFMANSFGSPLSVRVTVDDMVYNDIVVLPLETQTDTNISTLFWRNLRDIAGVDWQIEVFSNTEFEFYKFMPPEFVQFMPVWKTMDQVGPLDLNKKGIVYGARFRFLPQGTTIHYDVYDSDSIIYSNDITVVPNVDSVYIETFNKGIDPSVCRIVMTSPNLFQRYSVEFKVRQTGNETESKYIMVNDANTK